MSYTAIMDDSLFLRAVEGDTGTFEQYRDRLDQLVTPNDDSILHICITALPFPDRKNPTAGNYKFINLAEWVAESCPDLLRKQNKNRDTPLHMAARHGHLDIAIQLVQLCERNPENDQERGVDGAAAVREMIAMKNEDEDTALHEALRLSNVYDQHKLRQLVELLTQERNISYEPNKCGETPLYLAAERGVGNAVVDVVLGSQPPPAHSGPNGRTALHSAVIRNNSGVTALLLANGERRRALIKQDDQNGWIPLHYAAYFGYLDIVRLLLQHDKSVAYRPTNDLTKMLPLHLAASSGQVEVMKAIIDHFPGCCELVDLRKWNVLHFAVDSDKEEAVTYILNHPFLKNLINKKNAQGSTALHKLADSGSFMRSFVSHPQVDKLAFNHKSLNVLDLLLSADGLTGQRKRFAEFLRDKLKVGRGWRLAIQKDEAKTEGSDKVNDDRMDYIKDAREAHLVVATLIATVTFAAGFTLPGGYKSGGDPDAGGAILSRRTAFQAFIITDTIAVMMSSTAVFLHLFMALSKNMTKVYLLFNLVVDLTISAMLAMLVAFVTGTYAALLHTSSLAISTCVLGCYLSLFCLEILGLERLGRLERLEDLADMLRKKKLGKWIMKLGALINVFKNEPFGGLRHVN